MEDFRDSARKNNLVSTVVVGGTFGIFLTFGHAWSDFLKEAIIYLIPNHENEVMQSLIYALSATFFCILLLVILMRFDIYMSRIKVSPPRFIFNNRMTNANRVKEVEDVKIKNVENRPKKHKRKSRESLGKR